MNTKGTYGFTSWPINSLVEGDEPPVNCRLDKYNIGYRLIRRYSIPYPKSYEDIYQNEQDENISISVKVFNCDSFDAAKEQLAIYLSRSSLFNKEITKHLKAYLVDIAFGAPDGSGKQVAAVRGKTLIILENYGLKKIDLVPFYGVMNEKIKLSQNSYQS